MPVLSDLWEVSAFENLNPVAQGLPGSGPRQPRACFGFSQTVIFKVSVMYSFSILLFEYLLFVVVFVYFLKKFSRYACTDGSHGVAGFKRKVC